MPTITRSDGFLRSEVIVMNANERHAGETAKETGRGARCAARERKSRIYGESEVR